MLLSDFDYYLPEELIAQTPIENRDHSRLLVLDKNTGEIQHKHFYDVLDYINEDDLLVFNNTKVSAYRIFGHKPTGASVECLLTEKVDNNIFKSIVNKGKRLPVGSCIEFDFGLKCEVIDIFPTGERLIKFLSDTQVDSIIKEQGQVPLPPYIHKKLENYDRYQTVYAKTPGSCAAPTAGLHFTPELLSEVKKRFNTAEVTLNVGIGTFRPIKVDNIDDHIMHSEYYSIPEETKDKIKNCKGRIIAVGTTSTRALETAATGYRDLTKLSGDSQLFIKPGFKFNVVDCLITNFHIPKSTLLLLVSALAGKDHIFKAYEEAIENRYRFFSFGDAMFITNL